MEEDPPRTVPLEVSSSSVVTLHGHQSEVYICAWSPTEQLLASGWVPWAEWAWAMGMLILNGGVRDHGTAYRCL